MNTNNLIEHCENQRAVLHQLNLKRLENYLAEYCFYQTTDEQRYDFLQKTFSLNDKVLVLAYKLISNELKYICSERIDVPEALTLQDNLNRGSQPHRGFDMSTTKKYDVRNYTQLNKIMNMKEADMN